jgi:hypothetical protein
MFAKKNIMILYERMNNDPETKIAFDTFVTVIEELIEAVEKEGITEIMNRLIFITKTPTEKLHEFMNEV